MKNRIRQIKYNHYFIAVMAFIAPIILSNFYYIDDNYRAITGDDAWDIDGRPLSNLIMYTVNLNVHLADIFPIPTIISSLLIAFCMFRYAKSITQDDDSFYIKLIIPLGIMASPFLLENSSYRFDVLPMYTSIALSYVFVIYKNRNRFLSIFIYSACITAILSIYQASINFTLSMILCEFLRRFISDNENKNTIMFLIDCFVSLILGAIVYFKMVVPIFLTAPQTSDHPSINIGKLADVFFDNSLYYITTIKDSIPVGITYYSCIAILITGFISALFFSILRMRYDRSIQSVILSIILLLSPIAAIFFSFVSLSLLDGKVIVPRVMIGFSGTCLFFFTLVYFFAKRTINCLVILLYIPVLYSVGLYSAYANAMSTDKVITETLMHEIKKDSLSLSSSTSPMLFFYGERPLNKVFANSFRNYPVITRIVPNYFYNWTLPFTYMSRIGINIKQPEGVNPPEIIGKYDFCDSKKLISYDYNLIYKNDIIFVDFSKTLCK
ncbi:glucosyltransferase domain-containing protein [Enterobacter roggenkampii]|uniref:glucosyltransferase domain-containing protein n=1 Tax=Enterobacter roggenkampii TaxID=1812935 RepID=UPI002FD7BFA7